MVMVIARARLDHHALRHRGPSNSDTGQCGSVFSSAELRPGSNYLTNYQSGRAFRTSPQSSEPRLSHRRKSEINKVSRQHPSSLSTAEHAPVLRGRALGGRGSRRPALSRVNTGGAAPLGRSEAPPRSPHPVDEALRRERLPAGSPWPPGRLTEPSSIRKSARLAWYLAAARVASEPCIMGRPSGVQRYHLHARRRGLRWISKSGNSYVISGVPLTALSLQQAAGSSVHEKGFETSNSWI